MANVANKKLMELTEVFNKRAVNGTIKPKIEKDVQLPRWKDLERAIPNHLARSSLFAPVQRGKRKAHRGTRLATRSDVEIYFDGDQLDEADCDVWMQCLHEARKVPLGQPIIINRSQFLRSIGRRPDGRTYLWLHESMSRLTFGMLSISTKKYSIGKNSKGSSLHLIDKFDFDHDYDQYVLSIDARMRSLFSDREFALVDWNKRMQIAHRTDLAKFLQRLVATSADQVHRHALDDLRERACYTGRMRDFKVAMTEAMAELERLEIIAGARIELSTRSKEQVVWTRLNP
jgi:hypothetical protein